MAHASLPFPATARARQAQYEQLNLDDPGPLDPFLTGCRHTFWERLRICTDVVLPPGTPTPVSAIRWVRSLIFPATSEGIRTPICVSGGETGCESDQDHRSITIIRLACGPE
jgi:hypothetical protein